MECIIIQVGDATTVRYANADATDVIMPIKIGFPPILKMEHLADGYQEQEIGQLVEIDFGALLFQFGKVIIRNFLGSMFMEV